MPVGLISPKYQAAISIRNRASDRPMRTVRARAILRESSSDRLPRERWNRALPRLATIASRTRTTRTLIGSMGHHFILRRPMPAPFSAADRRFRPTWTMTLLTVVLLAAFVSLGRWQWQRGVDKEQLWEQFEHAPAPAFTSHPPDFDHIERFRRVAFPAHFEPAH